VDSPENYVFAIQPVTKANSASHLVDCLDLAVDIQVGKDVLGMGFESKQRKEQFFCRFSRRETTYQHLQNLQPLLTQGIYKISMFLSKRGFPFAIYPVNGNQ
jgi:hypothetical protein